MQCLVDCVAQQECFDDCHEKFLEKSLRCPCMSSCPGGCPCEDGYKCQPFITVVCQNLDHEGDRLNYIFSSDGHFIEERYYSIPESSDDKYPYLDYAGYASLNGEMFILGGRFDPKKVTKFITIF